MIRRGYKCYLGQKTCIGWGVGQVVGPKQKHRVLSLARQRTIHVYSCVALSHVRCRGGPVLRGLWTLVARAHQRLLTVLGWFEKEEVAHEHQVPISRPQLYEGVLTSELIGVARRYQRKLQACSWHRWRCCREDKVLRIKGCKEW